MIYFFLRPNKQNNSFYVCIKTNENKLKRERGEREEGEGEGEKERDSVYKERKYVILKMLSKGFIKEIYSKL